MSGETRDDMASVDDRASVETPDDPRSVSPPVIVQSTSDMTDTRERGGEEEDETMETPVGGEEVEEPRVWAEALRDAETGAADVASSVATLLQTLQASMHAVRFSFFLFIIIIVVVG
jgi:hypothetical protein